MRWIRPFVGIFLFACAVVLWQAAAAKAATTLYWDPAGTPATWDVLTTGNWSTTTSGATGTQWTNGDIAQFSDTAFATTPFTVNLSGAVSAAGINFASGAATLATTTSGTLTLTGGITDTSTGNTILDVSLGNTAGAGIILGAAQTWAMNSSGNLTVNAGVTTTSNTAEALSVTGTGAGVLTFNGILSNNGSGALSVALTDNIGTVIVNGNNTYTGATTLGGNNVGLIEIGSSSAFGTSAVSFDITKFESTSGTISLANNFNWTAAGDAADFVGTNNLAITGTLTNNLGNNTLTSSGTSGATLTLGGSVYLSDASATGRTLTINGTGATNISGVVANFNGSGTASGLTYTGSGTLTLSNTNIYTGTTTISSGNLALNAAGAISAGTLLASGGTVTESTANAITGATGLTLNGGTTNLSQSNNFSGTVSLNAATLILGNNNSLGTSAQLSINGAGIVQASTAVVIPSVTPVNFGSSWTLSGANSITFDGALQNYAAATTITSSITGGGNVATFAGSVYLSNLATTTDTLTFAGSGATLLSGPVANNSGTNTMASNLAYAGTGSLTLSNTNTYTGTTTVSGGGTLVLTSVASGSLGNTAVAVGSTTSSGSLRVNGNYTIGAGGAASVTVGGTTGIGTLGFATSEASPSTLSINSTATANGLILGGSTSGAAQLNFNYSATGTDSIATTGLLVVNAGGALVNLAPLSGVATIGTGPYTLLSYATSTAPTAIALGSYTLPAGDVGYLTTSTTAVSLNIVAGATGNAYWAGGTDGNWNTNPAGTTNWVDAASSGNPTGLPINTTNVYETATGAGNLTQALGQSFTINSLNFNNAASVSIAPGPVAASAITIMANSTNGITIASGSAANTISAPIILGAAQSWVNGSTSLFTVSGGITNGGNLLTVADTGTGGTTVSGGISGTGGVAMTGVDTLILSGASTYTGGTTIGNGTSASTVKLSGGSTTSTVTTLGALTNNTTVMAGSTLDLDGNSIAGYTGTIIIAGSGVGGVGAITNSGAGLTVPNGVGNITLAANASIGATTNRFDINGTLNGGGFTLTKVGTDYIAMKGTVTNLPNLIVNAGEWEVSNASGMGSGTVTVNSAGNLTFYAPPATVYTNSVTLNGGEIGVASGGPANLSGAFTLSAAATGYLGGTVNGTTNNLAMNISGPIGGSGNLQAGFGGAGGFITLSGTNNYTGTTTVAYGTLEFANEASLYSDGTVAAGWTSANINVNSGATLALGVGSASPYFTASDVSTILTNLGGSSGGFLTGAILGIDTTNAGGSFTYANPIANGNSGANVLGLTKIGAGTLVLTAANTYTGPTTINSGGTLQIAGAGSLAASIYPLTNNGTLAYNLTSPETISNQIVGTGGFSQIGSATVTLTNVNTYSGPTIVSSGNLVLASGIAPSTGVQAYYAFQGNANDSTANANNGTLAFASPGTANPTFVTGVTGNANGAINFNGTNQYVSIPSSSSLDLSGQYTVSFWENLNANYTSGNPTFISTRNSTSGANDGIDIQLKSGGLHADIGTTGGWLTVGADATVALTAGTWDMVTYSVTSTGYTIYVNGANVGSGTYSGTPVLMGSANGQYLTVGSQAAGGATPTPGNALNAAVDDLSIFNTALNASQVGSLFTATSPSYILPPTSVLTVAPGSTVSFSGNQTVASLSDYSAGSTAEIVNTGSAPVTLTLEPASGASTTYSGTITDAGTSSALTLVVNGAGTQVLAGTNTYSGATNIQNGTLVLTGSLATGTNVTLGSSSAATAGVFQLGNSSNAVSQTIGSLSNSSATAAGAPLNAVVGGNASVSTLTINNGSADTYNGSLGGIGTNQNQLAITKTGAGTLSFGGVATYSGTTLISQGMLRVTQAAAPVVQNASFESPALAANSFTYYASLSTAQQASLLPWTGSAADTIGTGAVLINNSTAWGYTTPYPNGNQALSMQNLATISQNLTFASAGTYTLTWNAEQRTTYGDAPGDVYFNAVGAATPVLVDNFNPTSNSVWTPFSTTITVATPGTYTLEFTGTVTSGASYGLNNINMYGGLSPSSQVQIASGATLDLYGTSQSVLSLGNSGTTALVTSSVAGTSILTVQPAVSTSATFAGVIQNGSGTVGLTMSGAGTQILTNTNTYTGPTTITAGTLNLAATGSIAFSTVTINGSTATLSGTGATGPVVLTAGAITPGAVGTIGTLTTGSMSIAAGTTLNDTLGTPGYTFASPGLGSLISAGALVLPTSGAPIAVNITNNANANGQGTLGNGIYPLIDYTSLSGGVSGAFSSTFAPVFTANTTGHAFSVVNTGATSGALEVVVTQSPVIYQDTFNRTGNLNASSPTIQTGTNNAWTANAVTTTASTTNPEASIAASAAGGATIGFAPTSGNVYTYSLQFNPSMGSNTADWLAMGLGNANDGAGNPNNANTLAWMLERDSGTGQEFYGGAAANGTTDATALNGLETNTIVLDARSGLSDATVSWYLNGVQQKQAAGLNFTSSGFGAIGTIVFGQGGTVPGTIQNLTLSSGGTWNVNGGGSWNTAANWAGGYMPNAAGASAALPPVIDGTASTATQNATITLDGAQTVGSLSFANSTAGGGNYTIARGSGGTLTLNNSGAGAEINNYYGANVVSAPVALADNVQFVIAAGTSVTLSGGLSDTGSHVIAVNPTGATGNLIISGPNSTNGETDIYGGTLTYAAGGSNSGGGAYLLVGGNAGTLTINSSGNTVAASTLAMGSGSTVNLTAGTLALTGNLTAASGAAAFNFNGGTLRNGNAGSTAISIGAAVPITIGGVAATFDTTGGNINSSAIIGGAGALTVQGGNILSLAGASTFAGNTAINAGTVSIGVSNSGTTSGAVGPSANTVALGALSGAIPASLVTGGAYTFSNPITVSSGTTGTLTLGGTSASASAFSGSSITLDNSLNVSQAAGGTLSIGDSIAAGVSGLQTLTFAGVGPVAVSGAISDGSGQVAVVQSGTGTTTLSGNNTFTGGVNISGGTLRVGSSGALNSSMPNAVAFSAPSGAATLDLNGYNTTISALSIASGPAASQIITNSNTSGNGPTATLTFAGGATASSFAGTLQDGGPSSFLALNVASGTLVLSGNNTYSGGTNVNAGMLRVGNPTAIPSATGSGPVNVYNNAILAGSGGATNPGSIAGSVSVAGGATISPSLAGTASAESIGTLSVGSLTLNDSSQVNYQVASASSLDSIASSGTLTLPTSGSVDLNFYQAGAGSNPFAFGLGTYPLMTYGSLVSPQSLSSALSINTGTVSPTEIAAFETAVVNGVNTLELVVTSNSGSSSWNLAGSGNWGVFGNWANSTYPNEAGQSAGFGVGTTNPINSTTVPSGMLTVTNDINPTVGSMTFNNPAISYTLSGGTITLNNNGAGASITVTGGASEPFINSNLTLAEPGPNPTTTFSVDGGLFLDVTGAITETMAAPNQQIILTGGGTLELDNGANSYSGGTTVNEGTLNVTAEVAGTSTLGTGPLAINGSSSTVNVTAPAITVGSLSGTGGGTLNVGSSNAASILTVNQTTTSTFNGTLSLTGGLVLAGASGNTLTISGTPSIAAGSSITVNTGTLALTNNNTGSPAIVGGAATATVASGATLQLAGSANVLSSAVNITTQGSGTSGDGALFVVGASTQTVGVISGTAGNGSVTTYAGNTTVGDGTNAANLTATQILQNTLTINAGSTVTIAPSGSGIPGDEVAATPAAVSGVALAAGSSASDSDSNSDPFTAIQAAIASGSISDAKGQQLENRIAAIERLATTDPGLDVSLLEDRVLAALPATSVWSSSGGSPLVDSGAGLLAVDNGTSGLSSGSSLGGAAAFAPAADFGGSPAAVPEPSALLLAILGGIGVVMAFRRRTICCE